MRFFPKLSKERLPLSRALLWVFLSTVVVSGSATLGWLYYLHVVHERAQDDDYLITTIVQTVPEKDSLPTAYLAELLGLSVDRPSNLYAVNVSAAAQRLVASPVIKDAKVARIHPGTVCVDYTVRGAVARLGDYTNTALDGEGFPVPLSPFFAPKHLPEVFLGLPPFEGDTDEQGRSGARWGVVLEDRYARLALELLDFLSDDPQFSATTIRRIDVSKAYSDSCGRREVVIVLEEAEERLWMGQPVQCISPRTLRLSTGNYWQELADYQVLRSYLSGEEVRVDVGLEGAVVKSKPVTVDMRIPQLAFLKEETKD